MRLLSAVLILASSLSLNGNPRKVLIGARQTLGELPEVQSYSSKDYVQDGLVSHLDGIDNAGYFIHDPEAQIWLNLIAGGSSLGNSSMVFGNDYVTVSKNINAQSLTQSELDALEGEKDYSVELLVEAGSTTWEKTISLYDSTGSNYHVAWFYPVPKRVYYSRTMFLTESPEMEIGETCYFCLVRHGTRALAYVNGKLIGTKEINNTISADRLYFYASPHHIKRYSIYSRPLSSSEIAWNYKIDKARFGF